jgi:hypothetical protein
MNTLLASAFRLRRTITTLAINRLFTLQQWEALHTKLTAAISLETQANGQVNFLSQTVWGENELSYLESKPSAANSELFYWLTLYHQLYGSFQNCLTSRQAFRHSLIGRQMNARWLKIEAVQAAIEENRYDYARAFLDKKTRIRDRKRRTKIIRYLQDADQNFTNPSSAVPCSWLHQLVRDRDVIILGNAPAALAEHSFENPHTVVALTNSVERVSAQYVISYLNRQIVEERKHAIIRALPNLAAVCLKSPDNAITLRANKARTNVRLYEQCSDILLNRYGPNAVQNAVHDILLHKPRRVLVLGTTFFAGAVTYRKGYRTGVSIASIAKSLRIHDPFSNFNFLRNLRNNRKIDVGPEVAEVLDLGELGYAARLQCLYGMHTIY